uniref:Ig-like domain-containing protein n=1 Tax=Strongyloides venezuelensis TaxID=75913 RepID=A0A0K0FN28_STRVS
MKKKVEPICNGIVPDKSATLHLKINDEKIDYKKMDNEIMLVRIDVKSRKNKTLHVGCHAAMDDGSGNRYEDFYFKRYKFVLLKEKLSNFNSSNNLDTINIFSTMDPKNIYGYYSCGMDNDRKIQYKRIRIYYPTKKTISIIVITIIVSVSIVICLNFKKKKRINNDSSSLSFLQSTSSSSSTLKSKTSFSNLKVPIVLGSLLNSLISMSASKSNEPSKNPNIKIVAKR